MPELRTLDSLLAEGVKGRAVLVRVDFNVPRNGDEVIDDTRLRAALPTLEELTAAGARVVLLSHGGRPKGRRVAEMSLAPVAAEFSKTVGADVAFAPDCIGESAAVVVEATPPGGYCLLENLRFHADEEGADPDFASDLAALGDLYVDDAFGCCHRAHASIVGLPSKTRTAVAGRLVEREVEAFGRLLSSGAHPFVAILGGSKIRGKIDAIENLLPRIDTLLVGGSMANTFLAARGFDLGASKLASEEIDVAADLLARAAGTGVEIVLPRDLVLTTSLEKPAPEIAPPDRVRADQLAVDIGPATTALYADHIAAAQLVFWNGPQGVFEVPPFDRGTRGVAGAVATASGFTVVGGGETVAAVNLEGVSDRIDHVSTGGGASLDLVAGKTLPGIRALEVS